MKSGLQRRIIPPALDIAFLILTVEPLSPCLSAEPKEMLDLNSIFSTSYQQVSTEIMAAWDSVFSNQHVVNNPLGRLLLLIEHFSGYDGLAPEILYSLNDIIIKKKSNKPSGAVATVALMQRMGWDVQLFYNCDECYVGLRLCEDWWIRKGIWIEKDGKKYYLKEFDTKTPVGELLSDDPNAMYASLQTWGANLKPIPVCDDLPGFDGSNTRELKLGWDYEGVSYIITAIIPEKMLQWTRNLPPSLYGAVACGTSELTAMSVVDTLKALVTAFDEFNRVNFLYKFCQSEKIFVYDSGLPIRSIAWQFVNRKNDCDGRSVLLYCLLKSVIGYTDEDIVFVSWPNHLALALKPASEQARKILKNNGFCVTGGYYILDAAYAGDTQWGNRMEALSDSYEIID